MGLVKGGQIHQLLSFNKKKIPLVPTVNDELLFHTGAPEFVVQKGEL